MHDRSCPAAMNFLEKMWCPNFAMACPHFSLFVTAPYHLFYLFDDIYNTRFAILLDFPLVYIMRHFM